jgi:hypothetical protein
MTELTEVEVCDRCKEPLEGDGRTLWMACFYAMSELEVPFKEVPVFHVHDLNTLSMVKEPTVLGLKDGTKINLGGAELKCSGTLHANSMYTLRVCKECRATWMNTIEKWFNSVKQPRNVGSGIFVRIKGTTVEVTEEEYEEMYPGRKPVRVSDIEP